MGGRKVIFGIISILISFNFLFIPLNSNSLNALDIKASEKQKQELQQEKEKLKQNLDKTNAEINAKNNEIKDLQGEIETVNSQLKIAGDKISNLDRKISAKNKEISNLEKSIKEKTYLLGKRLCAVYKSGETNILTVFFEVENFEDLIDKLDLISRLSNSCSDLVADLNKSIKLLNSDKEQMEKDKGQLFTEKCSFSAKQAELNDLMSKHEKALGLLNEEKEKEQSSIDENDAAYKEIQNQIDEYYKEQARKRTVSKLSNNSNNLNNVRVIPSGKRYAWPVPGFSRISSPFMEKRGNSYHKGIDIAGGGIQGADVVAADDGKVMFSFNGCVHNYGKSRSCGCGGGYGNYIFIDHGGSRCTVYGHLSVVFVKSGQFVKKGQVIGKAGSTGHSTGPHLHFECRKNNVHYDPMSEYN